MSFPKGNFLSYNFPSGNFPKVRLGLLRRRRLQGRAERCGWDWQGGRALQQEQARGLHATVRQTWDFTASEMADLGSYHSGNYPWEVAVGENAFGKVSNIALYSIISERKYEWIIIIIY